MFKMIAVEFATYVGSFPVAGSDELTRSEIVKLQLNKLHEAREKGRPVLIVISVAGIKVCSPDGKNVYMAHALKRISYASCDPELSHFSFLAREPKGQMDLQFCHAFLAESPEQAEELNTIIGNAFRMAYAAQLQRKAPTFHEMITQQMHQHHDTAPGNVNEDAVDVDVDVDGSNGSSSPSSAGGDNRTDETKTSRVWAKNEAKPTHRDPILDRIPRNVRDENCASWSGKGAYNQFQTAAIVNSLPDGGPRSIGASSAKSVPEFLNSTSDSVDVDRSHDNLSDLNSSSAESALLPSFSSPAADDPTVDELRDLGNSDNTCQAGNGAKPTPVKKLNGIAGSNALSRSDEVLVCQADCQGRFGGYVNQHGMRNGGGGGGGVGCNGSVFALDADARCSPPSSNDLNETASSTATSKSGLRVRIPQADACFDNHCCPSDKCARASSRASCGSSSTGSSIAGVAGSNCCSPHSFCGWGTPSPPERAESVLPCEEENLRGAPWFQAGIPREIALEVLNEEPEGAFLVRESTTKKGCFALSLRVPKHFQPSGIAHYLIMRTQRGYKIKGFMKEFPCLTSLITHHSVMPELLPCPLSLARYNPSFTKTDSSKDFAEIDTDPDYNTLSDFKRIALEADN